MIRSTVRARSFARASLACFAAALVGLISLHVLRPDYEPSSHMISDYAVGPFGWVMVAVFAVWSVGIMLLAAALMGSGPGSLARKVGAVLLGVTSIGLLVSAVFPADLPGAPDTRAGDIHTLSFLVNVFSLLIAIPLLSFGFREHSGWRRYRPVAIALAAFVVLAFLLQFLSLRKGMPFGLANRLFALALFSWLVGTAAAISSPRFKDAHDAQA